MTMIPDGRMTEIPKPGDVVWYMAPPPGPPYPYRPLEATCAKVYEVRADSDWVIVCPFDLFSGETTTDRKTEVPVMILSPTEALATGAYLVALQDDIKSLKSEIERVTERIHDKGWDATEGQAAAG